jgi:NLR family CARD domain-containing protein 3
MQWRLFCVDWVLGVENRSRRPNNEGKTGSQLQTPNLKGPVLVLFLSHSHVCNSDHHFKIEFQQIMATPAEVDPSNMSSTVRRLHIRDGAKRLDLRMKNIGDEEAKLLAAELATSTTLTWLYLSENRIGNDGAVALADALATNKTLKDLVLWGNGIGDTGITAFGQALMQNYSLGCLSVGGNKFGMVGLTSLADALKSNEGLTRLTLWRNSVGDDGVAILADALTSNTSLKWLDLQYNRIGNEGAAALGEALRINSTLTTLLFQGNNDIGEEAASLWLDVLKKYNTTLTFLCLDRNSAISDIIRSAIAAFIDANKAGIRLLHAEAKLDLSSKRIGDRQAKQVAMELSDNTAVTMLALNRNWIHHQGCADIADALIKNRVVTCIELNDNSIGDAGCSRMAAMLLQNTVLTKLLLNGNRIGPPGALALAETLRMNSSLRELGLGRNNVGNDGVAAITDALRRNGALERLDLSSNRISDEGVTAVLKALPESNFSLTWLNLQDNDDISPVLQSQIGFMMASRWVLKSICKCLCKPLERKLIPLVLRGVQLPSVYQENPELVHSHEAMTGPIFLLVRAAASHDSTIIKATPATRKRRRTP